MPVQVDQRSSGTRRGPGAFTYECYVLVGRVGACRNIAQPVVAVVQFLSDARAGIVWGAAKVKRV